MKPLSLGKLHVRNYSRANAKAQTITINHRQGPTVQRGSWWVGKPQEDFTAYASVMVVPVAEKGPQWKWREQGE